MEAGIKTFSNANKNASLLPNNLLAQYHPSSKYGVDHFMSLLNLNDVIEGFFDDINSTQDNIWVGPE